MEMSRNDFKKYCTECANKLYTDPNYTAEQYSKDVDAVKIIPLDLSVYPQLSSETIKWINKLFTEEDTDRNGKYMLRGFTRYETTEMRVLNLSYGNGGDALSFYAYNDKEMLVYTYCEGDTTLKIFNNKTEYEAEKADCSNFYLNER